MTVKPNVLVTIALKLSIHPLIQLQIVHKVLRKRKFTDQSFARQRCLRSSIYYRYTVSTRLYIPSILRVDTTRKDLKKHLYRDNLQQRRNRQEQTKGRYRFDGALRSE